MNRLNLALNTAVFVLLAAVGGYLFHSGGIGFSPRFSDPDDSWFRAAVLERKHPVVVKFGAPWCGPCRMVDEELDRLASSGAAAVVKIDVDRNRDLARHYRVSSIPDIFLFHKGAVVARRVGYADCNQLRNWVRQHTSQ